VRSSRDIGIDVVSGGVVLALVAFFFLPLLSTVAYASAAVGDSAARLWKPLGGSAMLVGAAVIGLGLPMLAFGVLRTALRLLMTGFGGGRAG
jgi:hypothetical protein